MRTPDLFVPQFVLVHLQPWFTPPQCLVPLVSVQEYSPIALRVSASSKYMSNILQSRTQSCSRYHKLTSWKLPTVLTYFWRWKKLEKVLNFYSFYENCHFKFILPPVLFYSGFPNISSLGCILKEAYLSIRPLQEGWALDCRWFWRTMTNCQHTLEATNSYQVPLGSVQRCGTQDTVHGKGNVV